MKGCRSGLIILMNVATIFSANGAWAADIVSLFDADSRVPGLILPFQVKVESGQEVEVTSTGVSVLSGAGECRTMRDPFIKSIFLLKCSAAAQVQVNLRAVSGGETFALSLEPFAVKSPSDDLEIIDEGGDSGGGGGGANPVQLGQQIFNSYCISCHNPASRFKGRTAAEIESALKNNTSMKNALQATGTTLPNFTAEDYQALEAYFGSL